MLNFMEMKELGTASSLLNNTIQFGGNKMVKMKHNDNWKCMEIVDLGCNMFDY